MGGGRPRGAAARDVTPLTLGRCQETAACPVQVANPNRTAREPTMRVLVAGATGAMGMELVPRLVDAGHEVFAMIRSESSRARAEQLGAVPVIADALDRAQVEAAVREAAPEVIVHQLTAIGHVDTRHFERSFAATDRLRIEGTDNLLAAARAIGVRRFVAQSNGAFTYARTGGPVKNEQDPLDRSPVGQMASMIAAVEHLEQAVLGAAWTEGIVLRYGAFYGPGTSMAPGSKQLEMIRERKFPIVGDGGGVWSFVHISDAAEATVAAVANGRRGVYNIVDDDPAPVAEWLPELAALLGAKKPMRVPRFVGRLAAGEAGVVLMTELRGASNAKAKRELGWHPAHPTWRQGFRVAP
ncbi:NAD-dependent epimerase/dehydratase family protein [Micromonospora avicenniae]|uniref:NAD-dependent epimerase/dehydratase family protein n=1 Tax=Micromonospora avicenniae TaxID=1198245 RepID=UPI00332D8ADD